MSHYGVHMYPYNNEVTLGNFNMPVNNQRMQIFKGVNNELSFTIHNADGKYCVLEDGEYLTFYIYDSRNNSKIFNVLLESVEPTWISESSQARATLGNKTKVYYTCVVPAGVLADLSAGSKYRWSIVKVTPDGSLIEPMQYMYSGLNYQASAELVISEAGVPVFVPSTEISSSSSWIEMSTTTYETISTDLPDTYRILKTSPVRADAQYGLVDGLSSIAFYFSEFIGRVQLQGCLSNDSPDDTEEYKWFIINLDDAEYYQNETDSTTAADISTDGIKAFNFKGNYMWIRVVCCIPPETSTNSTGTTVTKYIPSNTIPTILIRR